MSNRETFTADITEDARRGGLAQKLWQTFSSIPYYGDGSERNDSTLDDYSVILEQTVDLTKSKTRSMVFLCLYLHTTLEVPYEIREAAGEAGLQIVESEFKEHLTQYGLRVFMTPVDLDRKILQLGAVDLSDDDMQLIKNSFKKLKSQ